MTKSDKIYKLNYQEIYNFVEYTKSKKKDYILYKYEREISFIFRKRLKISAYPVI